MRDLTNERPQRRARALCALVATGGLALLAACPATQGGGPRPATPTAEALAADAEALAAAATQAGIPQAPALVEAYLVHHQGKAEAARARRCAWLASAGLTAPAAAARLSAVSIPAKARLRGFVAALLGTGTCDGKPAVPPRPGPATFRPGHFAGAASRPGEGHTEGVTETWLLVTRGTEVTGWALRTATQKSTDGRRFVCSKEVQTFSQAFFFVTGRLEDGRLTLQSTAAYVDVGPCAPKAAPALRCAGTPTPEGLRLACPAEITLRRTGDGPIAATSRVFGWQGVTPRAEGGRDQISETWHLAPSGDVLRGFYLRETVAKGLRGKTFPCSGGASFTTQRLFLLTGTRAGSSVTLQEVAALRAPGPCDAAAITLDRYAGRLDDKALALRYGEGAAAGTQTLVPVPGTQSLAPAHAWPIAKSPF